jgi:hypothetical protein
MRTERLEHPFRGTEGEIAIVIKLPKSLFDGTSEIRVHQNAKIEPIVKTGGVRGLVLQFLGT